jgi:hypothetical protein
MKKRVNIKPLLANLIWCLVAGFTIALFVASLPVRYAELLALHNADQTAADIFRSLDTEIMRRSLEQLSLSNTFYAIFNLTLEILFGAVFFFLAVLIYRRKSGDPVTLFVSLTLILFGTASIPTMFALGWQDPAWQLPVRFLNSLSWIFLLVFFYIFPHGRCSSPLGKMIIGLFIAWELGHTFFPHAFFSPHTWPTLVALAVWVAWYSGGLIYQIQAYRNTYTAVERKQTKWVLYALSVAVTGVSLLAAPYVLYKTNLLSEHPGAIYELLRLPGHYLFALLLPISIAVAIIRANLYSIDTLISRTLVYVPLTAILAGMYSASITLFQRLFMATTGEKSDAAVVMTTLFLASMFTPIKNGLQGFVDKRFKETPDTTKALKAFREELEREVYVLDPNKVARRLLDEAASALGAKSGAIYLVRQGEMKLAYIEGDWESKKTEMTALLRRESGRVLGRIALSARANAEPYTDKERQALEELAAAVAEEMKIS